MRSLLWCLLAALVAAKKSRLSDNELAKVVRRSQQSRPATCDDSRTFKSRLGDVSCKVLRKTSEPRRSELCGSAINWQGKTAAAACPKACRVCQYHEFVNGTLGRHVKCGGVLFITDLLGDVFTGDGPRCWPEFGRRWMVENGFEHVRRQTGDPCGNHYPFLFLRRKC